MPHIIPITELRDTTKIVELCEHSQEPIFITKNGYGTMVLMSMNVYEDTLDEQIIAKSLGEVERGEYIDGEEALMETLAQNE